MESRKISIISIIYRVEPYIRQCLDSLLKQTYQNLEILLVVGVRENPAENDNCLAICEDYAKKDSRIRVIACPARGIADARNVGMAHVTGDLIGFVDGDDWVDPDLFSFLVKQMDQHEASIAVCGRYYEFVNQTKSDPGSDTVVLTAEDAMRMILNGTGFFLHLWDKLFDRKLWDGVTFPTEHVVEDRIIVNRILGSAERICYNSTPKYHFRERSGSNSKKPGMEWHNAEANALLCEYVNEHFPALKNEAGRFYLQEIITSLQNLLVGENDGKAERAEFTEEIRKIYAENKRNPLISRTLKIKVQLALHAQSVLKWITLDHQKKDRTTYLRYQ